MPAAVNGKHKKAALPESLIDSSLTAFFEEPTYLVLINVPLDERFQYETTLHALAERGAGERPAQARFAPVDTSKIAFHRDETRLYGNNGVH